MKMHFTKMLTVCCAIVFGAFMTSNVMAQGGCLNTSPFGSADVTVEGPNGQLIGISTCSYEEEYSTITGVPAGQNIEFTLDADGDGGYITVHRDSSDGSIVAEGFSPVTVTGTSGADLYPHWNTDDLCGTAAFCVVTTAQCVTCPTQCPDGNIGDPCDDGDAGTVGDAIGADCVCAGNPLTGDCINTSSFGSADISTGGSALVTISTCSFQTEYSTITGVPAGEDIQFAIVDGGYITVRRDSSDGAVVAQGTSPVTVSGASGADLYAHWNTDGACGQASNCVETTVQCTSCGTDCPDGNIGDPCEDGDPATVGETIQPDCSCAGGVVPPANDNCEDVTGVIQCGEFIAGNTALAQPATNSPSGCGFTPFSTNDVWYAFLANGSDDYLITLSPGAIDNGWDGVLYAYSGPCEDLTEIACSDSSLSNGQEAILLEAPAAGVYYIQLYDYGFATSNEYVVNLECIDTCVDPFPAVDEASLSTTFTGSSFALGWGAVSGQIGCQIAVRFAGGSQLGQQIVGGAGANGFAVPGNVLAPGTDYEWRVRCGCSQSPIVAGPWSSWQPFSTPGGAAISSLPNPTEGQSNVTFTVVEEGYTTLEVFDMSGRLVDAIFTGVAQPNNDYRFEFDGSSLPNGVYIYRLTTENEVINDKFMIAK